MAFMFVVVGRIGGNLCAVATVISMEIDLKNWRKRMSTIKWIFKQILIWAFLFLPVFVMTSGSLYANENKIGTIKNIKGEVQIKRGKQTISAAPGGFLMEKDIIITGPNAALGIIFNDNSVLSMGPQSRLEIQDFAFLPAKAELSFVANIIQGTLTYISGVITKLKPESVKFKTPSTTVGIRGTHLAIKVGG